MALYRLSALASFLTSFLSFGKSDLDCLILYMNKRYFMYTYAYLFICLYICIFIFFINWNLFFRTFKKKVCGGKGQEKDVQTSGQTSTKAPSTDPVLYKIGEDNEGYQELRVTWFCDLSGTQLKYVFLIFNYFSLRMHFNVWKVLSKRFNKYKLINW